MGWVNPLGRCTKLYAILLFFSFFPFPLFTPHSPASGDHLQWLSSLHSYSEIVGVTCSPMRFLQVSSMWKIVGRDSPAVLGVRESR